MTVENMLKEQDMQQGSGPTFEGEYKGRALCFLYSVYLNILSYNARNSASSQVKVW